MRQLIVFNVLINPEVLGRGRSMFDGIENRLQLKLIRSRVFGKGNVLLCYEPC